MLRPDPDPRPVAEISLYATRFAKALPARSLMKGDNIEVLRT